MKSFVELHVEQSGRLEEQSKAIGVVQAITGSSHKRIKVFGVADHAGATPMDRRTDALGPRGPHGAGNGADRPGGS